MAAWSRARGSTALGTALRLRILFHNSGQNTVVFRTRTWHQSGHHQARDGKGVDITIRSTQWTTTGRLVPFRLQPGEFVEVTGAGIGLGANRNDDDWQETRVGSWIEAKEGDDVTFAPDSVSLSDGNEPPPRDGEPGWWLDFVSAQLALDLPLPADPEERTLLLYRAGLELFGMVLTAEEHAAFVPDRQPNALDLLAKRLATSVRCSPFTGTLKSGPTEFRVLPVDPDAANKARIAQIPGRFTLGENTRLVVSRRIEGERIVNEASIEFFSADPAKPPPGKPHEIKLPDGYNTWAAAWVRGRAVLWLLQEKNLRSFDFSNPAQVKETTFGEGADLGGVPTAIRDALNGALDARAAPATPAPAAPR